MATKTELRRKAKELRKSLPLKKISEHLVNLIRENSIYKKAGNVMLFYPTKYEIDLRELFNDNKNFYLPRVKGKELEVCPFKIMPDKYFDLKKSYLSIYEPCSEPVYPQILDLIIVPALMTDKKGYRLGYGGGFYDRFINKYGDNFKTLCPIAHELHTDCLPVDEFDKRIDYIISY